MKKAGILTFHRALNYGAVLQCYALKQTLQRLGFEADVIDYRQKDFEKQHGLRAIAKPRWFLKRLVTLSLHRFTIGAYRCLKTQHMFNCFVQKHLSPKSTCKDSEHISTGYDLYVIGSDQLWNTFLTGNKFDKVYCGFFTRDSGSKVITYAVSSNSQALNQQDDTLRRISTNFDEISICEKSLCDLFGKKTGYKTRCDLDPTLLAPPTIWDNLTNTKWEGRNYILIYEVRHKKGCENTLTETANRIAQEKGWEVIKITASSSSQMFSVEDFLSLFKYAQFVFTVSFHGTAMSLIFHRPFYSFRMGDGGDARYVDVLNELGLSSRLKNFSDDITTLESIDYEEADKKWDALRRRSEDYLKSYL